MAVLIGMSSTVKGKKFELKHDETFIGRSTQNQIPIDDVSISGRHCSIVRDGNKFSLIDLGSTNGTRLNGSGVTKTGLRPKDILQVGSVELMFDGQDVEVDSGTASDTAKIEVMAEPVHIPPNFHTASPFGNRKDNRKPWVILTIGLMVLVVAALAFFIVRMFFA
ncbi:MAG: FHA domain-containing protein [bacterium]|jgi:pSer/pThr/pTyr-binding forkhead associated (FHA) protein